MAVHKTQLRFDDVQCERGDHWAGPEGHQVYVIDCWLVCTDCVTPAERDRVELL